MKKSQNNPLPDRIYTMRGQRVMLDSDLARLYGVPTKAFNQAIKRNAARFPEDFAFQLTLAEANTLGSQYVSGPGVAPSHNLKSQVVTSSAVPKAPEVAGKNWSQFVTSSKAKHRGKAYLPWVFTEHGAVMAANVLRSPRAIEMSVYVVRAFVRMREELAANAVITKRLAEIDRTLLEHDTALRALWQRLQPLLQPAPEPRRRSWGITPR